MACDYTQLRLMHTGWCFLLHTDWCLFLANILWPWTRDSETQKICLSLTLQVIIFISCWIFSTLWKAMHIYRSNHRRRSVKKGALKNFANFTCKQMCWSLFLIKMQACLCWSLFLTPTQMFYCEICEIFKNTYFEEHVRTIASVSAKYKET